MSTEATEQIRVNFHCHSDVSDGVYPPETVAALLANDGIRFAALTDHDAMDGWQPFSEALRKRGVGCLTGVEITTHWRGNEIHLLAYGLDPDNPELREMLQTILRQRRIGLHTVITSLRTTLKGRQPTTETDPVIENTRPLPPIDCDKVIRQVHDAGGLVFLAHPWDISPHPDEVARLVRELKQIGMDGVEAYSPTCPIEHRDSLIQVARDEKLLISGGTDLHGPDAIDKLHLGIDLPTRDWKKFRRALHASAKPPTQDRRDPAAELSPQLRWKQLAIRFGLPALLTIGLFLFVIFAVLIPTLENSLMERKRETARELTAAAASLLEEYAEEEVSGRMTREEAQEHATARIRAMRYGSEGKDYYWIIDTRPYMVMHPYLPELDGTDLSAFEDKHGKRLFVESVQAVNNNKNGEGYVDYMWQWKDDATRIVPKLSHVRLFEEWGWIVGTGIYIEDVRFEIANLTERLAWGSLLIMIIVAGLLAFVVQQSLGLERQRSRAVAALLNSHDQYQLLVESATEGTLLLLDGKCAFANRAMLDLLGYSQEEIPLLDWHDLLPDDRPTDHPTTRHLTDLIEGRPAPLEHTGWLRRKNGELATVILTCQAIDIGNRNGLILSARDIGEPTHKPLGSSNESQQKHLIEELQSSLLFLNEPLSHFQSTTVRCPIDMPISKVALLMAHENDSAVLVESESGLPIGIVTDVDLRRRVLANSLDTSRPVHEIMSSPVLALSEHALVHEALLRMQESGVRHLALRNIDGKVTSIVCDADLLGFHRYASAVVVSEIERAETFEDLLAARQRIPQVVASLTDVAARPQSVVRLLSAVHDAITIRLLGLAMDQLGPPPVRFAFVCMGSQAREEETLLTDQDNGIIYQDAEPSERENVQQYFLSLGKQVCAWLDEAGYAFCKGGIMAQSPDWCAPASVWQANFERNINSAEPNDILRFDMCFDFRCVYGADELTRTLRQNVLKYMQRRPESLAHFARNTLLYKPPLGFFGKIMTQDVGEHEKVLDIKDAMMPIVKFARIYALREQFTEINTLQRLRRMQRQDLLSETSYEEIVLAFEFMANMRLNHQVQLSTSGKKLDNLINPKSIPQIEEATLRESLTQIAAIQKRVNYDFLGGTEA